MKIGSYIFESTIMLLILTWVLVNAGSFSTVISSVGSTITGSINALWNR